MYLFTRKSIQSSSPIGVTQLATPSILQRYNINNIQTSNKNQIDIKFMSVCWAMKLQIICNGIAFFYFEAFNLFLHFFASLSFFFHVSNDYFDRKSSYLQSMHTHIFLIIARYIQHFGLSIRLTFVCKCRWHLKMILFTQYIHQNRCICLSLSADLHHISPFVCIIEKISKMISMVESGISKLLISP